MRVEDVVVGLHERSIISPYLVIKHNRRGYRVDPDPSHSFEDWAEAWDDDISKAHTFTQKEARKFLIARATNDHTQHEARRELKFVPVEIVDGVPTLPKEKKKGPLSWLRQA